MLFSPFGINNELHHHEPLSNPKESHSPFTSLLSLYASFIKGKQSALERQNELEYIPAKHQQVLEAKMSTNPMV